MSTDRPTTVSGLALLAALFGAASAACGADPDESRVGLGAEGSAEVLLLSDVEWGPLNPARGDKGPKAGTLWGDRTGPGPSGFLVEFVDGFESPPHIHNVSYRGVAIEGLAHNDDPGAGTSWMPAGSFWTQPKGAVHITAAKGLRNLAYIEIEEGPYLVLPTDEAFESDQASINVDSSNIVWIDPPGAAPAGHGAKVAFLWGKVEEGELHGPLVKLPAGFTGTLRTESPTIHAVVIQGRPSYRLPGDSAVKAMEPGSSFSSEGPSAHQVSCNLEEDCVIYVRAEGKLDVVSAQR